MEAANIEVNYEGTTMQVFHQIRVGRFRFYNAASRDAVLLVTEAWRRGTLGKTFVIRPLTNQLIGEEVLDGSGRVIAVFGIVVTNAFHPDPKVQQDYQRTLRAVLNQL